MSDPRYIYGVTDAEERYDRLWIRIIIDDGGGAIWVNEVVEGFDDV